MGNSHSRSPRQSNKELPKTTGRLLTIIGPTASGKTGVAIEIAREAGAAILCADSLTVYRGMNIGTAKPSKAEQQGVKHYGLDLVSPNERFSAADFVSYAKELMAQVWREGKPLIVVGGSGMYIDALLFGYQFRSEQFPNKSIETMSHDKLLVLAKRLYPTALIAFDVKNTRRLRELITRGPANTQDRQTLKYPTKILGISLEKHKLQEKIAIRTQSMLNQGFVQEVIKLQKRYGDVKPLHATGYEQVLQCLKRDKCDEIDYLAQAINQATWQLVRKQLTWFRRNPYVEWCDSLREVRDAGIDYLQRNESGTIEV